jgi:hypothetical protein
VVVGIGFLEPAQAASSTKFPLITALDCIGPGCWLGDEKFV